MASLGRELAIPSAPALADWPNAWDESQPQWSLILARLSSGEELGDLTGASEVIYTFRHNRPSTVTFRLPIQHPMVPTLLTEQHAYVKAYKRRILACVYETTSVQPVADTQGRWVNVVATEAPYVRLHKRFIGKSPDGVYFISMDRADMARAIIDALNAEAGCGVNVNGIFPTSTATAGPWYYKRAIEAITELGAPLNGFDFWFTPAEPSGTIASQVVGSMSVAPLRGEVRFDSVFEYGDGTRANLADYSWMLGSGERITRAFSLPPSYPDNAGLVIQSADNAAVQAQIGLREDIIQSDLVDEDLRQLLADEHVSIRANVQNIFKFNPDIDDLTGRVPSFLFDYNIGDQINGRVKDSGVLLLDGFVRLYAAEIKTDIAGTESVALTVVEEA